MTALIHVNAAGTASAVFSAIEGAGWTGLGRAIPLEDSKNPTAIAKLAGLDYTVEKRECFFKNSAGILVKAQGREVLVRTDTDAMLSIASDNRYHIENRQPIDIVEAFRDQLQVYGLDVSHAAALRGGADVAVCCMLPEEYDIIVGKNDRIKSYITASTGYDGKGTRVMKGTIRVVCWNTLNYAVTKAIKSDTLRSIRASTLLEFDSIAKMIDRVKHLVADEKETFTELANTHMSNEDVTRYFADVLEINVADLGKVNANGTKLVSTKSENILKQLAASYANAPGAAVASGTAWGALNAVTYYGTHLKTVRDTSGSGEDAARVASNMTGDAARLKVRALQLAAAYSGKVAVAA